MTSPSYSLSVSPEGDRIILTLACSPVAKDHEVHIPTDELREVVAVARSRQLGVDAWGDL